MNIHRYVSKILRNKTKNNKKRVTDGQRAITLNELALSPYFL